MNPTKCGASSNGTHTYTSRSSWEILIPLEEFMRLTTDATPVVRAEIIRALVHNRYLYDICISCGHIVFPATPVIPPTPIVWEKRNVKVEGTEKI